MALTRWQPPALRHDVDDDGRVTWLELFFDLIYVAALIQLGDRLADEITWAGVARFVGAFVVLWWTWTGTTAFVNRFAVDDVLHRVLTFVQMFAVGNFAILAATDQVDRRTTWLVVAYVAARLPLLAMYARVREALPEARPIADLYLRTFSTSLSLWAISLLLPSDVRWWLWAVAVAVEFVAPVLVARRDRGPKLHAEHIQERYALFTIIVLGETFVKTLTELTAVGISPRTLVLGGLTFAVLISLWWTYFDDVAESAPAPRSSLTTNAGSNGIIWVYVHLPLAIGLTAYGVAAKKVVGVEALDAALKPSYAWLLGGSVVVVLVAVAVIDVVTVSPHFGVRTRTQVVLRLVAAVGVAAAAALLASGAVSTLVGVVAVATVTAAQITAEVLVASKADRRIDLRVAQLVSDGNGEACEHLADAGRVELELRATSTCRTCDEHGTAWVQLRVCLDCGHVGCCDDSPGRHATGHHGATGHPTIATIERGDRWAYCYVDEVTDAEWWPSTGSGSRPR